MGSKKEEKKAQFTPGPWNDVHVQGEGVKIVATGPFAPIGQRLAWVPADDTEQLASGRVVERVSIEARANARLIAQAPRMHEFIARLVSEKLIDDGDGDALDDARAILAAIVEG
jgi:hypothetical protein